MYTKKSIETLLLLAAGTRQSIPTGVDWEEVATLAGRHGVAALLSSAASDQLPDDIAAGFKNAYSRSIFRNFLVYNQLSELLQGLNENGVPVIALKGSHLAEVVYGDIGLRPMSDIDILVQENDLPVVNLLMEDLGYRKGPQEESEHHHLPPFIKEGGVPVEVHTHLSPPSSPYGIDVTEVWSSARKALIAGMPVSVLAPEILLLYLCVHVAQHEFDCELRHFYDIKAVIGHFRNLIEWDAFIIRSREWNACKAAFMTLTLAREMLDADVPAPVLEAIRPDDFSDLFLQAAKEQLFSDWNVSSPVLTEISKNGAFGTKVKVAMRSLFLPRSIMAEKYKVPVDSPWLFIFYLRRGIELLLDYALLFWRLIFNGRDKFIVPDQANLTALRSWLVSADSIEKQRVVVP